MRIAESSKGEGARWEEFVTKSYKILDGDIQEQSLDLGREGVGIPPLQ